MEFSKVVDIELKSGQVMQLQMTDAFIEKIRSALMIPAEAAVTERHIKSFLVGSMKNALEGSEDGTTC